MDEALRAAGARRGRPARAVEDLPTAGGSLTGPGARRSLEEPSNGARRALSEPSLPAAARRAASGPDAPTARQPVVLVPDPDGESTVLLPVIEVDQVRTEHPAGRNSPRAWRQNLLILLAGLAAFVVGAWGSLNGWDLQRILDLPGSLRPAEAAAAEPLGAASPAPTAPATSSSPTPTSTPTVVPVTGPTQAVLDARCLQGRVLCADKTAQQLYWVVDGRVQASFEARFGRPGHDTPEGRWSVYQLNAQAVSRRYGDTPMPFAIFYDGNFAVHYSEEFARNANPEGSHGCVNLKDYQGADWLFRQVQRGDTVVVYRS